MEKSYYANGKLRSEAPYKNGDEEGAQKYYYESGKLRYESLYMDGQQKDKGKYYDESGTPISEATHYIIDTNAFLKENLKDVSYVVDSNGKPITGVVMRLLRHGWLTVMPCKNGKEDGIEKAYSDGELRSETPYKNGKREGVEKYYDDILDLRLTYKDDEIVGGVYNGQKFTPAQVDKMSSELMEHTIGHALAAVFSYEYRYGYLLW